MYENTFAISGMGRSGTKFLAKVLNASKIWEVKHEVDNDLVTSPQVVLNRFSTKSHYGEVSSYLRHIIHIINLIPKRAVIVRNPHHIWLSICNREKDENKLEHRIEYFLAVVVIREFCENKC